MHARSRKFVLSQVLAIFSAISAVQEFLGRSRPAGRKILPNALEQLPINPEIPIITRDQVEHAKPDPDLFLRAAARLNADIHKCMVVGDSVLDLLAARRARALGIGLLSGGYGQEKLERAGAYRVYQDPLDLLRHLDEVGVRIAL